MAIRRIIFSTTGATSSPPQDLTPVITTTDIYGTGSVTVQSIITANQYRYYNDGDSVTFVAPATNADGQPFYAWNIDNVITLTTNVTFTVSKNAGAIAIYKAVDGGLSATFQQLPAGGDGTANVIVYKTVSPITLIKRSYM